MWVVFRTVFDVFQTIGPITGNGETFGTGLAIVVGTSFDSGGKICFKDTFASVIV
jgi:hypothetical protein